MKTCTIDGVRTKKSKIYSTWRSMIKRCDDPNSNVYHNYGGRGITVCDRWRNDFIAFVRDMGPKPTPKHSIDRINNDGNYEPGNCRWATSKEQCRNYRGNTLLTINGEAQTMIYWAEKYGVPTSTIINRLNRGCSHARALGLESSTKPSDDSSLPENWKELCASKGLRPSAIYNRVTRWGWNFEKALEIPIQPTIRR